MAYAYSIITCQTAWLSWYYPLEFFVASLSVCSGNTDKVRAHIKAVKERGYEISAPNINLSNTDFTIKDDAIIFGLNAIKGVGHAVTKKIIQKRPKDGYKSFGHFIQRNIDILNSKILEGYAKAGCFKCFGYNKETIIKSIPYILDFNNTLKTLPTDNIFDVFKVSFADYIDKCVLVKSTKDDTLSYEIDSMGLYISEHPMDTMIIDTNKAIEIGNVPDYETGDWIISVGCINGIAITKTKSKMNMAKFNLTDGANTMDCIIFPGNYPKFMDMLAEGKIVAVSGKLKKEESGNVLLVNEVTENYQKFVLQRVKEKKAKVKEVEWYYVKDVPLEVLENDLRVNLYINENIKFILERTK